MSRRSALRGCLSAIIGTVCALLAYAVSVEQCLDTSSGCDGGLCILCFGLPLSTAAGLAPILGAGLVGAAIAVFASAKVLSGRAGDRRS